MIGIKVNGRFLDIKPGFSSEIERKSPFFAMEEYAGESMSDAMVFRYTPNNALALGIPYHLYTERKKIKLEVEHYEGNSYRGKATLILETGVLNLNNIEDTEMSGILAYGLSNLFQAIKGKRLQDLKLGGVRSFNFTTSNPDDASDGYWQHFHNTWTDNTIPYVFYPVRNEGYLGEDGPDWINKLDPTAYRDPNISKLAFDFSSPLVPMIRFPYLLEQIFAEIGFSIDLTELNGTGWDKLTIVNLVRLKWTTIAPVDTGGGTFVIQPVQASTVHIDLSEHVPQDKTISDFIIQFFFRYGWAVLFDANTRKCRISLAKKLGTGVRKNWTKYASPNIPSEFNQDRKIFAFKNEIDSNDEYPSAPDFANFSDKENWISFLSLRNPTAGDVGRLVYCHNQNQWYQAIYDDASNQYVWEYVADNIFDEEPKNSTDSITTTISTLPVQFSEYRQDSGNNYGGFFPIMNQNSQKNIGYRFLFYFGLILDRLTNADAGNFVYPYASSIRTDHYGITYSSWSNVYKHEHYLVNEDYGIIPFWWKEFLSILQAGEENNIDFHLPLHELVNYQWDDVILIKHISFVIKSFIEPTPYNNPEKIHIRATVKRLTNEPYTVPVDVVDTDGNVVRIYARLTESNVTIYQTNPFPFYEFYRSDYTINLYSDSAGTIPYFPPATLYVLLQTTRNDGGSQTSVSENYYPLSSNFLFLGTFFKKAIYGTSGSTPHVEYIRELIVNNSTAYTVI